jgi:hypothetical protein
MINRRKFLRLSGIGALALAMPGCIKSKSKNDKEEQDTEEVSRLPSPDYYNINNKPIKWDYVANGLKFSRTKIYRDKELVDIIAAVSINSNLNKIRVFNEDYDKDIKSASIEDWQNKTGALVMINGNQYMAEPLYHPCALVICDGKQKGPKYNKYAKGMLVAEPRDLEGKLKKVDLLDFNYDTFDYKTTLYTQGVQHWPIILDREGKIRVNESKWQANRTVVAKTKEDNILFMTTEGGYFTLYNLGRFLKESNEREDGGFNVHTAMNMDGAFESQMIIKSQDLQYINYGKFIRKDPEKNPLFSLNVKAKIPNVIGVFPRY